MKIILSIFASISTLSITYELYHPLFNPNAKYWGVFLVNSILILGLALMGERGDLKSFKKTDDFFKNFDSVIYYNQIFNLIHMGLFLIFMLFSEHTRFYTIDIIILLILQFQGFVSGNKIIE